MDVVPPIHIKSAIHTYGQDVSSLSQWKSIPWLWEKLPMTAKVLSFLGTSTTSWWRSRYVFPLLVEVSSPHLQRFKSGDWQKKEEESLTTIFHFFSSLPPGISSVFSSQILDFLKEGIAPSFQTQRQKTERKLASSQLGSASCAWFRDETFAQYCSRMHAISVKPSRAKTPNEEIAPMERVEEPVGTETRERGIRLLRSLEVFRDTTGKLLSSVKESTVRSFPLRLECCSAVLSLQELQEEIMTLLIAVEGTMTKVVEPGSGAEKEVLQIFRSIEKAERNFSGTLSSIQSRAKSLFSQIESARSFVYHKLQHITSSLDHVPLLPASNTFRPHQSRLIRTARDLIKKFRLGLTRGPGPMIPLERLEKEVLALSDLAKAFHREGIEIEKIGKQLLHFEQELRAKLQISDSSSLRALLADVEALRWTLEVSSDRRQEFDRIEKAFEEAMKCS
jgi:hypothetical protein